MKRLICGLAVCCFIVIVTVAHAEQPLGGESGSPQSKVSEHRYVTGVVDKITDGAVFVKTDGGAIREFSLKEVRQEKIKRLTVGDRLQLELDNGDQIIVIARVSPDGSKRQEAAQFVEGQIDRYDPAQRVVTLKLGDGASRSYHVKDAAATKINPVSIGTRITLDLDPVNGMVNDFIVD